MMEVKEMARIKQLRRDGGIGITRFHSETDAAWGRGEVNGRPVLCIRTYGSRARQDAGTVSQAIDIDEQAARQLLAALAEVFPSLGLRS